MSTDKWIETGGVKLHYRDSDAAGPRDKAIVMMHGWGCSADTLASIERTAVLSHRVINVDLPGFGLSTEPPTPWGVEQYTRAIEELVKTEGLESPALLGHSFGGRLAIVYASRNPVDRIVLVDAAGIKPRRGLGYYRKVWTFKIARRALETLLGRRRATPIVDRMRARRGSSDYAGASEMMRRILSRVVNEDLTGLLPKIGAPTLLVWGENDTATPIADARLMERLIPDAGLVTFPGCGHYSFLDNPATFAAVLKSFLSD